MIRLQFTEASIFENSFLRKQLSLPVKKRRLLIGRGQDLQEKESNLNEIINLINFSNTLSRVHASIDFSPAWFLKDPENVPMYLKKVKISQTQLPPQLLEIIWTFIRPKKQCILRDLKSKFGVFKKVERQEIQSEMVIEFVHPAFITFHNCQQYENFEQLQLRINSLKKSHPQIIIFGNLNKIRKDHDETQDSRVKKQLLRFWQFSVKENLYVLLIHNDLILRIGRSSHCEIQMKDTAISRYQAYLKCEQQKWRIIDGNQVQKSKNGTWKRCRKITLETSVSQINTTINHVRIGSIRCQIQVIENFEWLNIGQLVNEDGQESGNEQQSKESKKEL